MNRRLTVLLAVVVALFALAPVVGASHNENFTANLKARNEVQAQPVVSNATGEAIVKLRDGELSFKLIVANLDNAVAAHIHCGSVEVSGPVGVTLFSGGPISDSGILAQGEIAGPDPGNACGWSDLAEVIAAIKSGDTYVNVHTPAFPGGEIRGQLS